MKFEFLEKLEEKYVFKTSHIFFHILVGLSTLAVIVGLLFLLWGITPSFKPGVEKAEYPPPVAVTPDEITTLLPAEVTPVKNKALATVLPGKKEKAPGQRAKVQKTVIKTDSAEVLYEQTLDSLKALLPQKYLWVNRGHSEYGSYKDNRGHWQYGKHWVVDRYGIPAKLGKVFRNIQASDYSNKAAIVKSYFPILSRFDEKNRYNVLKNLLLVSKTNMATTKNTVSLLLKSVYIFPVDKTSFFYKLTKFAKKNPRDGASFISYANQVLPKFDKANREKALNIMISGYYKYYNDLARQKEATDMFLPMLPKFKAKYQPVALAKFYKLYEEKNRDRRYAIERIESEYRSNLRNAERVLAEKKRSKATSRYKGAIGLGGGVVLIALIALLLSLLSIQRNIRELRTMMIKKQD